MKINLLLCLFMVFMYLTTKAQTHLTPEDFGIKLANSSQAQLIDVRTPEEYKDGHLKMAENIDYKSNDFKDQVSKLDKSKPVFVYCLGGVRSAAAADILHESGFSEIYDMKGGYIKWTAAGKEVDAPKIDSLTMAGMSMNEFISLTSSENVVLVDFNAPWCDPCVQMLPTIHKLAKEYEGKAKIATIQYDPNKGLAKELHIYEIPAFLIYKNGKLVSRKNGLLKEADFRKLLDSNL